MHEKFTKFIFKIRLSTFFRWGRRSGRRSCRCRRGWHVFESWRYFCFKPHVWKHLTDTFLYFRIKITVACTDGLFRKWIPEWEKGGFMWENFRNTNLPLRRNQPCINSWARIAPVSNLHFQQGHWNGELNFAENSVLYGENERYFRSFPLPWETKENKNGSNCTSSS